MSAPAVLALTVLIGWQAPAAPVRRPRNVKAKSQPPFTILFFTASWCEPCRAVGPLLEKFASKDEERLKLVTLDFDRAKAEAERWGVREVPVVIVLSQQGQVLLRCEGAQQQTLDTLKSELESLFKSPRERR